MRLAAKIAVWVLGFPCALLILIYAILLVTPIRLPFVSNGARALAMSTMAPSTDLELGDMGLALEGGILPVLQFSSVVLSDYKTGARIAMDALEIGFSPIRALLGQPGATVTMVGPRVQIVQDLFGPRVARFELVEDPQGGPATVRVLEGETAFPAVDISAEGVAVNGDTTTEGSVQLRSDNDWLIYNLTAAEASMAQIVEQVAMGRFSRLVVRDGTVEMSDSVYGLFRRFEDISLNVASSRDRRETHGTFSARLGGRTMTGSLARTVEADGGVRLEADISNIDFASFLPFIDDPDSIAALRGAGAISIDVQFSPETGQPEQGRFKLDLTGLDLRIKDDFFPVASSIIDVAWSPPTATFAMSEASVSIGESSARLSGVFALGLDAAYGPTIGLSMRARNLSLHPSDMEAPASSFEEVVFNGWSAPLYGATGIDRLVATKGDGRVEMSGRIDMLRAGMGFDLDLSGHDISADDLKRLWPYLMAGESRDWLVANVPQGTIKQAQMSFSFPVGSVAVGEEDNRPLPEGSISVDMVGTDVAVAPMPGMAAIDIDGEVRLRLRDEDLSVSAAGGRVSTAAGPVMVSNPALVMETPVGGAHIFEISADIRSGIPALLALVRERQPELLENLDLPVDLGALEGDVDAGILTTITLADADEEEPFRLDYVVNGTVADFASSKPVLEHEINDGQLLFSASQESFQIGGTATIDGKEAEIEVAGTPRTQPVLRLASTVSAEDLAEMGFDASEFFDGEVRVVAQPDAQGTLQVIVDLTNAEITLNDLGISKPAGVPGTLRAVAVPGNEVTELRDIDLAFGSAHLVGALRYHASEGLQSAEFSTFQLSQGDSATLKVQPINGGYALIMRGSQFDLKPMLRRYFGLGAGTGGVKTTQFNDTFALDIELERAVGFYQTTAFNVDLDLLLSGSDLRRANISANFSEGNALAVTTNTTPEGRIMSMAFNDAGTILRLLGVYSQLAGGQGSLVLNRNAERDMELGELQLQNFSLIDEANVAQVLGNHQDSRELIARENRLDFQRGQVTFVRRDDRIEVTDGVLSGQSVGGTLRGFIFTNERQYDLTGTYVPLFGLNNAFRQIPLIGPLLGGREGEGLVGVTFAVRGPLDNPQFRINPLSALLPGVFRELFEFQTQTQ
ncbi:AsmA-like C-terminal domain-containing protein [Devosia nitrariae]|uniref:AsmA-like protein n=1 Tax=Devosia nitrariae TaxID=2071872 RepID=A0ABQ5WCU1_9HYPH|nr:AsmA-like C-terminal domain-containing protein [Devosia nitrariae]GLQ57928.1 hypothetical protein GCM10010862_51870 [Devosia nitrariae]